MENTRIQTGVLPQLPCVAQATLADRMVAWAQRLLRVRPAGPRALKHMETLSLGPRKAVHVIECDGRRYLVCDGLTSPVPTVGDCSAGEGR